MDGYMTDTRLIDTDQVPEYTEPTIADYGDLAEVTAAGTTGGHVDGTYYYGEVPGFLSTAP
jgi:hypothetical protein